MKRVLCFILIIVIFTFAGFAVDSKATDSYEASVTSEGSQQEADRYIGYYISGCGYSSGVSRVTYNVLFTTITISGPTGTLMVVPVSGIGYFDFPTQPNQTYLASAPGYDSSMWVAW